MGQYLAFFAHSLFWYLFPGSRFHALEWGIPGYRGPAGLVLGFCSAFVCGLYIRELRESGVNMGTAVLQQM
jgi:hypothetical protein